MKYLNNNLIDMNQYFILEKFSKNERISNLAGKLANDLPTSSRMDNLAGELSSSRGTRKPKFDYDPKAAVNDYYKKVNQNKLNRIAAEEAEIEKANKIKTDNLKNAIQKLNKQKIGELNKKLNKLNKNLKKAAGNFFKANKKFELDAKKNFIGNRELNLERYKAFLVTMKNSDFDYSTKDLKKSR